MSQQQLPAVGQVSADGQFRWDGTQWAPIARGEREPTSWTRPMQLAAAALFVVAALYGVVTTLVFVNHDSLVKALQASGTQLPSGTDVDTVINISMGVTIGFVVVLAVLELVAALGSFLGWRWMFWVALVFCAFGGLGALTNLRTLANPAPFPVAVVAGTEVLSIASLAVFAWMLVALVKFGPWAMKRPGA